MTLFAPWFIQTSEREKTSQIPAEGQAHGSSASAEGAPDPATNLLWEDGDISTSTRALNGLLPAPKESFLMRKITHSLCLAVEPQLWLAFSLKKKHYKGCKHLENCFDNDCVFHYFNFSFFSIALETFKTHCFLISCCVYASAEPSTKHTQKVTKRK